MASQAPLDFDNYRAYEGQANPTTQAQLQNYMANQNDLLTEILQTLVWLPSRVYALNNVVYCGGGLWAKCTTAGTSGATEPQWNTGTISDGGCVWSVSDGSTALNTHIANTNNPHSVTKAQVGLGNVVNTGDSATPVSGGTTKFTTGGAFTELAKKLDIAQGSGNVGKALVVNSSGNVAVSALKTINNNSLVGSGNITALTEHQSIKTINGNTMVGSGDVTISGGNKNYYATATNSGFVVATISGATDFELAYGVMVTVNNTSYVSWNSLNVNQTGSKTVILPNVSSSTYHPLGMARRKLVTFVYNGSNWVAVGTPNTYSYESSD